MPGELNEEFLWVILSLVEEIPFGRVASYGQLARLAGRESRARMVGRILRYSDNYGSFPCHRVVNSQGRTAPGFTRQRELLEEEGVEFKQNGCVDMARFRWEA